MRIRHFLPLLIPSLTLLLAFGCGDDDGGESTPSPRTSTSSASTSATPDDGTATPVSTPTPSPTPDGTPQTIATPSRSLPASADRLGIGVLNVIAFLQENGLEVTPVPCPYEVAEAIINCSAEGYGRIGLDPIPIGDDTWNCRALLKPEGEIFGASCTGAVEPIVFYYSVEE